MGSASLGCSTVARLTWKRGLCVAANFGMHASNGILGLLCSAGAVMAAAISDRPVHQASLPPRHLPYQPSLDQARARLVQSESALHVQVTMSALICEPPDLVRSTVCEHSFLRGCMHTYECLRNNNIFDVGLNRNELTATGGGALDNCSSGIISWCGSVQSVPSAGALPI